MIVWRIIKWLLWSLVGLCVLVGLLFLFLMTETVQTPLAKHFLKDFNRKIAGEIAFSSVHVPLGGDIILTGLSVRDSAGSEVIGLDKLKLELDYLGLSENRIHVRLLKLTGLRVNLEMDSTGGSNIASAFQRTSTTIDTASADSVFKWTIKVDELEINGEHMSVLYNLDQLLNLDSWELNASGSFADNLIDYKLDFNSEPGVEIQSKGDLDLSSSPPGIVTDLTAKIDSTITVRLPSSLSELGSISLTTSTSFQNDSLESTLDFKSSTAGSLKGEVALLDPDSFFYGTGQLQFEHVDIAAFMEDSTASNLNGSLKFNRRQTADYVNGWDAKLVLDSSSVMSEQISTELAITTEDSTAWVEGHVATLFGEADLDLSIDGFDTKRMGVTGSIIVDQVSLHHFAPVVPDSLSPLSGYIDLDFGSVNPDSISGRMYARLNEISLGQERMDSVVVSAFIEGKRFEMDTLKLLLDDIRVEGSAQGDLGGMIDFYVKSDIPDLAIVGDILRTFDFELDTLGGHLNLDITGSASLAGDSLSGLNVRGDIRLGQPRYGEYHAEAVNLSISDYRMDENGFAVALDARGITVKEQLIDSVIMTASGTLQEFNTTAQVWAQGDTLQLTTTFGTRIQDEKLTFSLEKLVARAYGTEWTSLYPNDIYLVDDRVELDGLVISSDYGIVRAIGFMQAEGEQDMAVELSGFETGKLAELLEVKIPDAQVNIRLQITGTDTALTGDVSVHVDSMIYNGKLVADQFALFASIQQDQVELQGYSTWYADTLTVFSGTVPARLNFTEGFVLRETEPLNGEVFIFEQPMERLNPWMAVGTKTTGFLSADLKIRGTPRDPEWEGFFKVHDGTYVDSRIGINYKYMVIDGTLTGDSLYISQFRATSKGTLSGSGYAIMGFPWPERLNLDLKFDKFRAVDSPRQKGRLSGTVKVTGPFNSLDATGSLGIEEAVYQITQATSKEIETIDIEPYLSKLRGDSILAEGFVVDRLYKGMSHDLRIKIPGNCWVRGGGLNIELLGDISLYKEKDSAPLINGVISVKRGTVEFAGREMTVEKGTIEFLGPIDDPTMSISALDKKIYNREGAEIRVRLYGPVSSTSIEFTGKLADGTELTPEEVIRALVLGTTKSSDAMSFDIQESATNLATAPVSKMIERASGLDVFQFRPGEGGINDLSTGSLEVGTYVTDRLYIRVLQPIEAIQTGQEVSIEYQIREWLKLIAEQKGREQSAFDLFVQVEWR
jgi:autotransporter translocation and assembly factor TamB